MRLPVALSGSVAALAITAVLALAVSSLPMAQPASGEQGEQREVPMKIRVIVGDEVLTATLDDSASARDFASLFPLELTLEDYASTEKVSELPRRLSTDGAPRSYEPSAGDITYYAPWGNLAIFYRGFRESSGLVRLGAFDGDIGALRRDGPFRARFEMAR